MKLFTSSLAVLVLATLSTASVVPKSTLVARSDFTICSTNPANDLMAVNFADYNPKPPVPGQLIKVDVAGDLKTTLVAGAKIKVSVNAGILTVWQKTYDLCVEAAKIGQICPIAPGPQQFSITETVPSILPPGTYTLKAVATTSTGQAITCITQKFTI
ncbi:ML domain-containing protein [Cunninghamella echinulata]|nr:ML domain-containing protein [Cunninghamella echinulata]